MIRWCVVFCEHEFQIACQPFGNVFVLDRWISKAVCFSYDIIPAFSFTSFLLTCLLRLHHSHWCSFSFSLSLLLLILTSLSFCFLTFGHLLYASLSTWMFLATIFWWISIHSWVLILPARVTDCFTAFCGHWINSS